MLCCLKQCVTQTFIPSSIRRVTYHSTTYIYPLCLDLDALEKILTTEGIEKIQFGIKSYFLVTCTARQRHKPLVLSVG